MILLVLLDVPACRRLDLFQLVDIHPCKLRRGKGLGGVFLKGRAGLVHRLAHFLGGGGQLFHRRNAIIRRVRQSNHGGGDAGHSGGHTHDDVDAWDGGRQQRGRCRRNFRPGRVSHQGSCHAADHKGSGGDPFHQAGIGLDELVDAGENVRSDFIQSPHFRDKLLSDGGFQSVPCGFHQGKLAVHIVQLDICHALGRSGAVVDAVGEGGIVGIGGVQNSQEAVITALSGDGLGVCYPFGLGHLLEVAAQFVNSGTEILHGAVGLDCGVFVLPKGRASEGHALQQAIKRVPQGGTGDRALDAAVCHEAHSYGHVLDAIPQGSGHRRRHFERLAHDGYVGVGAGSRCRQHVGEMGRVLGRQPKGAEAVRHNVGHHSQILAGRRRQLQNAVHALEHIGGVPPGHRHVAHSVAGFLGSEFCCCPQVFGLLRKSGHLLGAGPGQGLHGTHCLLEVAGNIDTLYKGVLDLPEAVNDRRRDLRTRYCVERLCGLVAKPLGAVRRLFLLGLQLFDFGGQFNILLGQIRCIDPGLPQLCAGGIQFLALPFQRRLGVLDTLLQLDALPLQTGGRAVGLPDFLLE